jgi:carbon monoxide dehydrogenase subunit G
MPEITKEIDVKATLEDTWALVSDMERFSLCIPGCKKVTKISETEFDWDLETKVLRTTRKAKARTKAILMQAPSHSEFIGEGRLFERSNHYKLLITGTTDLETISEGRTKIIFAGVVKASGLGGAIIEKVAAGQMDSLFQEFEDNIKHTLGDTGSESEIELI